MQKLNHLDDPQNPLGRRLFLISPQPSLSIDVPVDSLFDQWWTIRDHFDLLEMDETWRPS
jgi:hypothetical protein